jgi:acetyl esterase/lipase
VAACVGLLESGEVTENLIIAGDSAGGGLAISTLLSLRDRGLPLPAAAWLLSPAVDLADERASWRENLPFDYLSPLAYHRDLFAPTYLGEHGSPLDPLVSPVRADLQGLPPLLIQVGEKEILRDQVVEFASQARAAGVEVVLEVAADMVHVYPAFAGLTPQADQAFEQAGGFMRARTTG